MCPDAAEGRSLLWQVPYRSGSHTGHQRFTVTVHTPREACCWLLLAGLWCRLPTLLNVTVGDAATLAREASVIMLTIETAREELLATLTRRCWGCPTFTRCVTVVRAVKHCRTAALAQSSRRTTLPRTSTRAGWGHGKSARPRHSDPARMYADSG